MARPLRIEYCSATYHVMNRGNQRDRVYRRPADYQLFLEKLAEFSASFRVQVRSYCLMPNHFHLYLMTNEANLSRFMQSLLTSFTILMNRQNKRSGHLFQGRFKALLVESERYGSEVSRYLHLNPIRTREIKGAPIAVRRDYLRGYEWSSYGQIIGLRACPSWIAREEILKRWGGKREEQERHYAEYVERGLLEDVVNPGEAAAVQSVLGSEGFIDRIRRGLKPVEDQQWGHRECGQRECLRSWVGLEELINKVAAGYQEKPAELLRRYQRNHEGRQVLLYLAARHCRGRYHLTEIAARVGGISVGALSRAREKMQERLLTDGALATRINEIESAL